MEQDHASGMDAHCQRSCCRQAAAVVLAGLVCALFSGCLGSRGRVEGFQAALREQGQQLTALQDELQKSKEDALHAQREVAQLREQLAKRGGGSGPAPIRLSGIQVIPMLSSTTDQNSDDADDAVTVTFAPVDDDGEVVKFPGTVEIAVLEPDAGQSRTISSKKYTLEECRERWVRSFLGSGYQFTIPWEVAPEKSDVVVHVQMKTADGRAFEATHLVKVASPGNIVQTGAKKSSSRKDTVQAKRPDYDRPQRMDPPAPRAPRPEIRDSTNWTEDSIPVYR